MKILKSAGIGFAWFLISSFVSCNVLTAQYAKEFPRDGQDGLSGLLGGIRIGFWSSLAVTAVTWLALSRRESRQRGSEPRQVP
ncbi:MAG: hypothetical protein INR62_14010 [Rhodospirillales bacterium]|nr:hypothetical protein [Acetobacter sp.]